MDTPCIIGIGCDNGNGYLHRRYKGGWELDHRIAWMEQRGPIPDGLCVCHHCDNRKCRNIEHLFLGTQFDNMSDASRKGRMAGIKRGVSKLTVADVAAIRAATITRQADIASVYGIDRSVISRIRSGRAHATAPTATAANNDGHESEAQ